MADNEIKKNNEHHKDDRHHGEHHHHHRHHHYLMDIDHEHSHSHSSSHSKKEKKERKVLKKIDLSEKPLAVWVVVATFIVGVLALILMPHNVFISETQSISKWTAVSVCFSFASIGGVLYLMRDRMTTSKADSRIKKAVKGLTQIIASSGLIILLIFAVTNVAVVSRNAHNPDSGYITKGELEAFLDEYKMKSNDSETERITLNTPEVVNIAPEALNNVITDESGRIVDEILNQFRSEARIDVGYPATISFTIEQSLADSISYITVEVSEDENLANSRLFTLESSDRSVDVYHLKTGTKYYYRVNAFLSNGGDMNVRNRSGSFETDVTPRILSIDGVRNVRDIGGWMKTEDGRSIKQGLLFRGTEIDGQVEPEYKATADGIADMKSVLGIKSDFDLRAYNTSNPLEVEHKAFAIPAYEGIFKDAGKEKVKILFSELANPVNYPIYMHCTHGTDRTGVMMYLLELMLGVDEESATKDYEFSSMFIRGITRDKLFPVITELDTYEGRSMQEKVRAYLKSCGVTEEDMESIKAILLQ